MIIIRFVLWDQPCCDQIQNSQVHIKLNTEEIKHCYLVDQERGFINETNTTQIKYEKRPSSPSETKN